MQYALVLSADKQPLDPCHPARARELLREGKAAVFRRFPFTIILKERTSADSTTHAHRLKLDPGSKTTGIALVREETGQVVFAAELTHRGQRIRDALLARRGVRRSRRQRKTRYRPARFQNRARPRDWLAPSLEHRVKTTLTWVSRLRRFAPVSNLSMELVRFDLQKMENPEISGCEYQQGTLAGYEVKEYLLEKWGRRCAYCAAENIPLEVEHIIARASGGSDRVSNLTLSCIPCNQKKGTQPIEQFLARKPDILRRILAQAKRPLKDAAAVNTTRWALYERLKETGLPVEVGSGGRTKYNRKQLSLPKAHWLDAACVGASTPPALGAQGIRPLLIQATGHGSRQMCGTNASGFPVRHRTRNRSYMGFRTGDIVRAVIIEGKNAGVHSGRVAIRQRPSFRIGKMDVHPRLLSVLQRSDGYDYRHGATRRAPFPRRLKATASWR